MAVLPPSLMPPLQVASLDEKGRAEKEERMNTTVKNYELVYTGGGFTVAYGVYINGKGFSIGYADLYIYDEDARNEFEVDYFAEWEEAHKVDDFGYEAWEFKDTLIQIWLREKAHHNANDLIREYDLFRDNLSIITL